MNLRLSSIGKLFAFVIGLLYPLQTLFAQTDSIPIIKTIDSTLSRPKPRIHVGKDSILIHAKDTITKVDSMVNVMPYSSYAFENMEKALVPHPYYNFRGKPWVFKMDERKVTDYDRMFYILISLVFLYALLRAIFTKYHDDFFKVFFRATLRQQQLKEQLIQASLPSLLFNILFLITGSFYLNFIGIYSGVLEKTAFFANLFYSMLALAVIYVGKFLVIKSMGWVLRVDKGADSYIFIVFLFNKVLGVLLIPLLILIAFTGDLQYHDGILIASLVIIGCLFLYRFWASFQVISNEIKLNIFHFFLYLCAFEIAPLFVMGKLLLKYF